ncbi:MAG TPA: 3-phosphoshikimate 1-carboxyvinyltransferase [Jatrophihabitantaceae bacterium]|nr:3-phosphoshikimate 1-carboxyvinyltransferase [Jatrophihabitantaceae bacterium]
MTWPAPHASGPVRAVVRLPGSKSQTNRALLLASIADGPSRISAPLMARDTQLMRAALTGLGVSITDVDGGLIVRPGPLTGASVDTGLAGTVMRFVPPVAALASGVSHFDGDPEARRRPMAPLLDGLRQAGVEVDDGGRGRLPFSVRGGQVPGGMVSIDASSSSQFLSALLLAGARYDKGIEVRHVGAAPVPSAPHVAMTVAALRDRGVEVDDGQPDVWRVASSALAARDETVEPDLSNAAPFLAAALVTGGTVEVPSWPARTTQAGDALRGLLADFGAEVLLDDSGLTVTGPGVVHGIDVDLNAVGELTPVIAAVAALADAPSRLRGIGHLRGHETDRLAALAADLTGLGGAVREERDRLTITPRPLHGGMWRAFADHRTAQAGAVVGLAVPGVEIDDISTTTKTLPDFPGMWMAMLRPAG